MAGLYVVEKTADDTCNELRRGSKHKERILETNADRGNHS